MLFISFFWVIYISLHVHFLILLNHLLSIFFFFLYRQFPYQDFQFKSKKILFYLWKLKFYFLFINHRNPKFPIFSVEIQIFLWFFLISWKLFQFLLVNWWLVLGLFNFVLLYFCRKLINFYASIFFILLKIIHLVFLIWYIFTLFVD